MPTLLDESEVSQETRALPADRLRETMTPVRVSFTWFGIRRTLTPRQKEQAAERFGAEGQFLTAAKKVLDSRHPAFRTVTAVRHRVLSYWKGVTLPYPEPGLRLIGRRDLAAFNVQMTTLKQDLAAAVAELNRHYAPLRRSAQSRLGSLYNPLDYPASLEGLFEMTWDWPNIEPPDYLRQLSPVLYEQESHRVRQRFEEAVQLAEQAFLEELSRLVSHLGERLSGSDDGRPKVFRDSAVENLTGFFQRFRVLNVRSNEQLDDLVEQARRIVQGVEPQTLRDDSGLRQQIATQLSGVQSVLDGLLIDRPRRNIVRSRR